MESTTTSRFFPESMLRLCRDVLDDLSDLADQIPGKHRPAFSGALEEIEDSHFSCKKLVAENTTAGNIFDPRHDLGVVNKTAERLDDLHEACIALAIAAALLLEIEGIPEVEKAPEPKPKKPVPIQQRQKKHQGSRVVNKPLYPSRREDPEAPKATINPREIFENRRPVK